VFFLQEKSETQRNLKSFLRRAEATMGQSSKILKLKIFLMRKESSMTSLPTHLYKMVLWRARMELLWIQQVPCLKSIRHLIGFRLRQSTWHATPSTGCIYTESSRKPLMNSSPVKSLMFHILESFKEGVNALFF
jgi:hypothetical protein